MVVSDTIYIQCLVQCLSSPHIFEIAEMATMFGVTKPHMNDFACFHPHVDFFIQLLEISSRCGELIQMLEISSMKTIRKSVFFYFKISEV